MPLLLVAGLYKLNHVSPQDSEIDFSQGAPRSVPLVSASKSGGSRVDGENSVLVAQASNARRKCWTTKCIYNLNMLGPLPSPCYNPTVRHAHSPIRCHQAHLLYVKYFRCGVTLWPKISTKKIMPPVIQGAQVLRSHSAVLEQCHE